MIRSAPWTLLHAHRRALAATAMTAVGALVTAAAAPGLATAGTGLATADTTAGQRVLQSVQVDMAPDGTFTAVKGTTVSTNGGSDDATSSSKSYSPQDAVSDLPVRVLTAYRTEGGTGTDLSDLSGYTGRVEIDLTVQNLTIQPQNLSYDVDGSSRSQAALVGAPLTVVASTALDGIDASSVVTPDSANHDAATNGVLSQSLDGTTQVQWATILAPPQIGPSATLKLVLDAKDFKAPAFDLSVQPGLVTDPSVGALVDAAFQPGSSSELKLQARTIGLVGEVNTVLARAGETISKVRTTLDSSADTLGTKTASDLQASATGVAASMKGLDGSVKSLGQDLSTSLESTRSAAVQQLLQTVDALDQMLGDTSVKPQPATVKGEGCDTTVAPPQNASSVYGNLIQVAGQLDGYAKATGACKSALQASILKSVGPENPTAESCVDSESVTCALLGARTSFSDIATKLVNDGDAALSALDPMKIDDAVAASDALSAEVDTVTTATQTLVSAAPYNRIHLKLHDLQSALDSVKATSGNLGTVLGGIHDNAVAAQGRVATMTSQNASLAAELCQMVGDGSQPDTLSADKVEQLRSYLVPTSCPDANGNSHPIGGSTTPMSALIDEQGQAWAAVAAASDDQATASLTSSVTAVQDQIDLLRGSVDDDSRDTRTSVGTLDGAVKDLQKARAAVKERIANVKDQQAAAIAGVKDALKAAADDATTQVAGTVDPQIRQVTKNSEDSREALGRMFDKSASGLASSAGSIASNGAKTLNAQKASFAREQQAAGAQITAQVQDGLASISQGVSSSTRDMEAAGALLTQDLNRVLLDLGSRTVHGSGLLGAMTTGAATARSADYQLALATDKTTSYANVRSADIGGILLRQAQSDAALKMEAELPAFGMDLPSGTAHRTVYTFHIGGAS
jgi:hypothetical protein